MLHLTINGHRIECAEGSTLLAACRAAGIDLPTLCDDPRLEPIGACRLCLVEVMGQARPVTACNTAAAEGMDVQTHTPDLEASRRTILRLLAHQYPAAPLARFPDKPLHRHLRRYGLADELRGASQPALVDASHPYIHVDMSQCIQCFRCVRICSEVQGQFVWQVWNRGDRTKIVPESGRLADSPCVSCGACVDTCPTGALEDAATFAGGNHTNWTRTTCPYCGTGCEMSVGTSAGRIVAVRPVQDAPVNKGHLCVKGRYAYAFNDAPDRITEPMIREGSSWRPVDWERAIEFVAQGLRRVVDRYGPDSVGVLGSARATNEDNYVAQKFARVVLGTNNVDCCARVCHAPSAAGMKMTLGTGAATNSFDDIERASAILVCGANATENHPIVGARIKQAALGGVALIVIDPRRIELTRYADVHLQLRPGTNVPLLNAMACTIVEEGLCDSEFIEQRVSGWQEFVVFIRAFSPETVAGICHVEAALIKGAARLYAKRSPAMCFHGLGLTEHVQGTAGVMCLVNLALLTGNLGKPGSGINPLRGQNNVQGAAHMGCDPDSLTGSVPLEFRRELFELVWHTRLPADKGLNMMQMMDGAREGKLKALWPIGYDVALTNPRASKTRRALEAMELVIVQDLFLNQVCPHASVFLPAASAFEKEGTFMNAERRIQRVRKAVEPRGAARADWRIVCDVARAMGHGPQFDFASPQEIWEEIRAVWPEGRGITYRRLDREGGVQWPCPAEDHPGTHVLHTQSFPVGRRAPLSRVAYCPTPEVPTQEFPLLLVTGRTLYQFNAGTMTLRTANVALGPEDVLEISLHDAARLGVRDGERVRVRSRYGQTVLPVRITVAVAPGELFATFHTVEVFLNEVTGSHRDGHVDTPEYKVTAVALECLPSNACNVSEVRIAAISQNRTN